MNHATLLNQIWSQARPRTVLLVSVWILLAGLLVWEPVTHPEFGLRGDMSLHYHITRAYAQSVAEGNWLPRWAGLLDGGRGDALFTFYPPLTYFSSLLWVKVFNLELLTALKLTLALSVFAAQASAYYFARAFFSHAASLKVALLYVGLPALPILGLNRCFLANAVALSLVPLALRGAYELLLGERMRAGVIALALGLSGVLLSHVITTYLCAIAIALLTLVCWPQTGWRGVWRLSLGGCLVVALTAFFLVPQLIELPWVRVELQTGRHDYRDYLLFAAPADASQHRQAWALLNQLASSATLAQVGLALLCLLVCWPLLRWGQRLALPLRFALALVLFMLSISLPVTAWVWRWLPGLSFIQFPWRFLPFVSLACGLIVAAARTDGLPYWLAFKPLSRVLLTFFLALLVLLNSGLTWAGLQGPVSKLTATQTLQLMNEPAGAKLSMDALARFEGEDSLRVKAYTSNHIYYRPRGAELDAYPPATQPGSLSILNGRGRIVSQSLRNQRREFVLDCAEAVSARLETYHYPHWIIRLDGREIQPRVEAGSGLMLFALPVGQHTLSASFEPRHWLERVACWLSVCAWVGFCGWLIQRRLAQSRVGTPT
ncbi:MAG: hypothetical protein HYR56_19555 [Acidobacteria bacterium]|nr:hypothetical protein [Acidobacteriota bacterium]MBI3426328.1 hypothetical protein [Acidobacteriota bacterium]